MVRMYWMRPLLIVLLCWSTFASAGAVDGMEYRYWDWGQTSKRDDYQYALLQLALERTTAEFGPYRLSRVLRNFSTLRSRREVAAGTTINVRAGPWLASGPDTMSDGTIAIDVSLMGNLLGTRVLLIRRADLPVFNAIERVEQLKALNAGQAAKWVEVDMYRRAGFRVVDADNANTLLLMLANKRFDYLPMSVIEVQSALAHHPELGQQLTVAPTILLSYPLPVVFHVSARHPQLARRLERGLLLARRDGSFEALLRQYFSADLADARRARHVFRVANPNAPAHLLSSGPWDEVLQASPAAN